VTIRSRSAAALAAAVTGAALLTPLTPSAPAVAGTSAGSIVFIKDFNVWIANGDGSAARQLTTDGREGGLAYLNPSQSDTGVIAASRPYGVITILDQQGNEVREIDPIKLPGSGGHPLDGAPVSVSISPDGNLIAYSFAEYCGPGCGYRTATGYTSSAGATDPAPRGTSYLVDPSWVTNTRTLQSGGFGSEVMIDTIDAGTSVPPVHWFDTNADYGNVEVSPDGKLIAGVADERDVDTYFVNGDVTTQNPPGPPGIGCHLTNTVGQTLGAKLSDPTWGPDSRTLAWAEPDGIWTFDHPATQAAGCEGGEIKRIIPGGSAPDWAKAQLSAPTMNSVTIPAITGSATVGGTLTASGGTWTAPPTGVAYQWFREDVAIAGATGASYAVTAADAGKRIKVVVTASRTGWPTGTSNSHAVSIPATGTKPPGGGGTPPGGGGTPPGGGTSDDLRNTRKPAIAGKALVGRIVKATSGAWSPQPTKVTYQWLRDGKAIKRAKAAKYRITKADRRHRIAVRVTAILSGDRASAVSKAVTVRR
jgi:hypothetical protein